MQLYFGQELRPDHCYNHVVPKIGAQSPFNLLYRIFFHESA